MLLLIIVTTMSGIERSNIISELCYLYLNMNVHEIPVQDVLLACGNAKYDKICTNFSLGICIEFVGG